MEGWVERLAAAVIEQIRPWVPAVVEPGWSEFDFACLADQPGVSRVEGAEIAVRAFLDGVQDLIVRHTAEWWPGVSASGEMLMLTVEVTGNHIEAWFGDETSWAGMPTVSIDVEVS
jgi:hypothetical protein